VTNTLQGSAVTCLTAFNQLKLIKGSNSKITSALIMEHMFVLQMIRQQWPLWVE